MPFMNYRLRMLLEQCKAANSDGRLTRGMLDDVIRETFAYKEPASSDIRYLLIGPRPGITPKAEIRLRLRQAQRILSSVADYD